jgi:glycosyltransferase involved in cell wall biosynthesis
MRILIICHFFPPLNSIASLRPYSWAKYWTNEGNAVHVLTTRKYGFDGPLDLRVELPPGVKVSEVDYLPPVLRRGLGNLRWYGSGSSSGGNPSPHWVAAKKAGAYFRRKLGAFGDTCTPWIPRALARGTTLLTEVDHDVMVSTLGPPATHVLAARLKRRFNKVHWVADYRDLWTGNHLNAPFEAVSLLEEKLEHSVLSRCDLMTTISKPLAVYLERNFKKPAAVVENGFEPGDYQDLPMESLFPHDRILRLVYTGTLYPGKRDPSPLFAAVKSLEAEGNLTPMECRLIFYGGITGNLMELIKRYAVSDWVELKGHVDRPTALRAQRDADGLIFLEWNDPSAKGVLTGKIFEYIVSGKPILGIGIEEEMTESAHLIGRLQAGECLGHDVERIKNFILKIRNAERRPRRNGNDESIRAYTRESLALKYLNLLSSLR